MNCTWVDDAGEACGEPAEVYMNLVLCSEHTGEQQSRTALARGSLARQAAQYYDLNQFPGLCYFVLLPDGNVKIGYSNTEKLLRKRLLTLGRQYGAPVVKLAIIEGGFVAEAVMHDRFKESRLPGLGERFRYTAEMAEYLASISA